ncbi:MAG: hypothetical protein ACRYGP_02605 [Janthinobacterium lividum]
MTQFAIVEADQSSVRLRHVGEAHEYEFAFTPQDGGASHKPHLISHTEGDGCTGTGLAGQYLEQARAFAASIHEGEGRS